MTSLPIDQSIRDRDLSISTDAEKRELQRLNRTLRTLSAGNRVLLRASDEQELLHAMCRVIVDEGGYGVATVLYAQHDIQKTLSLKAYMLPAVHDPAVKKFFETLQLTWADTALGRHANAVAIRTGNPVIGRNLLTDPDHAPWRVDAIRFGYAALTAFPLRIDGEIVGSLGIAAVEADAFDEAEVKLLGELADDLAYGIGNLRARIKYQQAEARVRRLVESNIIGIFFWGLAGPITEANDALLQIVGYSRPDLETGRIRWTRITPPEYRSADMRALEQLRQSGVCTPYEKEYVRKDGQRIPVLIGGAMLEGSQENGVAFVLDLTERRQAEAEREARHVAEAANRAKSEFLSNMSHELRTPLNGILGYAQVLRLNKNNSLDQRQLAGVNVIQHSGENLLTLINDILELAKIEAGKVDLYPTDVQLAGFLRTIAEIVSVKAQEKDLALICELPPDLPSAIQVDEKRLRQILLNLLSNAIKFTDHGHVHLRAQFTPPARLRFEVQDTGIGIREDQLETIFQPFEQAGDAQRRLGGTGLGLAISRRYVQLMGSDIQVESRVGGGSTFRFELDVPVVRHEAAPAAPEALPIGYAGARRKVLVVDDVAENRALLIDMLGQLGFETAEAANGEDALGNAQTWRPDFILMDIAMPEMDGLEAMRRLRRLADFKEVPIVAISARGGEEEALVAGMNAFLPKPIDFGRLLPQIGALLGLDWIYRPQQASPAEGQKAERLVAPPAQEIELLHRLAQQGDMREIVRWASRMTEFDDRYRPFADQLSALASGYQSKAVLSFVKRYLDSK